MVTPNERSLLRYQCRRARYYYRLASERLPRTDRRSLVAAEIMGEIYFAILRKIERARYDVFSKRHRVAQWSASSIGTSLHQATRPKKRQS